MYYFPNTCTKFFLLYLSYYYFIKQNKQYHNLVTGNTRYTLCSVELLNHNFTKATNTNSHSIPVCVQPTISSTTTAT